MYWKCSMWSVAGAKRAYGIGGEQPFRGNARHNFPVQVYQKHKGMKVGRTPRRDVVFAFFRE